MHIVVYNCFFRYLLRNKPEWTSRLRDRFLDGFHIFVKILRVMQVGSTFVRP